MDFEDLTRLIDIRETIGSDLSIGTTSKQTGASPIYVKVYFLIRSSRSLKAVKVGSPVSKIPTQDPITLSGSREHDLMVLGMKLNLGEPRSFGRIKNDHRGELIRTGIVQSNLTRVGSSSEQALMRVIQSQGRDDTPLAVFTLTRWNRLESFTWLTRSRDIKDFDGRIVTSIKR